MKPSYLCAMNEALHTRLLPYVALRLDDEVSGVRLLVGDVSPMVADARLRSEAMEGVSPFRRAKAVALTPPRSQALSLGAALLLDALLSERGLRERDMNYVEGEHGKPELQVGASPNGEPRHAVLFNLSHSGALAAAALLASCQPQERPEPQKILLGVDIQRVTRYRPELVRRVFSHADLARLSACPDEVSRERLFAQLWSRAEAYAKATGDGLRWPFPEPPAEARFHDFAVDAAEVLTASQGDDGRHGAEYYGSLCLLPVNSSFIIHNS